MQVVGEGVDGEELSVRFPKASEIEELRTAGRQQQLTMTGRLFESLTVLYPGE